MQDGPEPTRLIDECAREPRIERLEGTGLRWRARVVRALGGPQLLDPRLQAVASFVQVRAQGEWVVIQDGGHRIGSEVQVVMQDHGHSRARVELGQRSEDRHPIRDGSRIGEQRSDLAGLR